MNRLSEFARKHCVLGVAVRIFVRIVLCVISLTQELASHFGRYERLLAYRNRHAGNRCFIIATGPSLTREDLELLRNEYTFGMNALCLIARTWGFTPTYYGIQDHLVYDKLYDVLMEDCYVATQVFVSSRIKMRRKTKPDWNVFPLNVAYHSYDCWFNCNYHSKFSNDCSRMVYNGFTITYSLIQLAVYMGFSEIYLIGVDGSYPKDEKHHFIEYGENDHSLMNVLEKALERVTSSYITARNYAEQNGIVIKNATRGGKLEVFERVKLENVLAKGGKL